MPDFAAMKLDPDFGRLLFLDLETVATAVSYENLPDKWQQLWQEHIKYFRYTDGLENDPAALFDKQAALESAFARLVCIGTGLFYLNDKGQRCLRVGTIVHEQESQLLQAFLQMIENPFWRRGVHFCSHNGKDFVYPFLSRRILVNGLDLPQSIDLRYTKPWEVPHVDTMELWRFGDSRYRTSLNTLAALFDIETQHTYEPQNSGKVFYEEKNIGKIKQQSRCDVITTAQVFLRLKGYDTLLDSQIFEVE